MPGSSDDESTRRDERRERRRQKVHDRLANLIEENKMLTLLTQEDADEISKLRLELEAVEAEKRRLVNLNDQQDTVIKQLQDQIFHLEHARFVADVQAKTIEQQDTSIKELMEETKLLSAQTQMDAESIKALHRQLNEVVLERDRLATRVGRAIQRQQDAEGEVKMLVEHADELRQSNGRLADRCRVLEEQVQEYEAEDYADFFTRVSKRDIAAGKLMPSEAQFLLVKRQGTPPDERERAVRAREAGISVKAMREAEESMPRALTVGDVAPSLQQQQQQHNMSSSRRRSDSTGGESSAPGVVGKVSVLELSPEQLRILASSGASPSPKKFSAYALQAQFGISPDKNPQQPSQPAQPGVRSSKEAVDLQGRHTELPLPKSVQHPNPSQAAARQHQQQGMREDMLGHRSSSSSALAGGVAVPAQTTTAASATSHTTNVSSQLAQSNSGSSRPAAAPLLLQRRPLAHLPVRDALSGSIVAPDDFSEELPGDRPGPDLVLVGGGPMSPAVDSDSDDGDCDSPNKTMERNAMLHERLEVQRRAKAAAATGYGDHFSTSGGDGVDLGVGGPVLTTSPTAALAGRGRVSGSTASDTSGFLGEGPVATSSIRDLRASKLTSSSTAGLPSSSSWSTASQHNNTLATVSHGSFRTRKEEQEEMRRRAEDEVALHDTNDGGEGAIPAAAQQRSAGVSERLLPPSSQRDVGAIGGSSGSGATAQRMPMGSYRSQRNELPVGKGSVPPPGSEALTKQPNRTHQSSSLPAGGGGLPVQGTRRVLPPLSNPTTLLPVHDRPSTCPLVVEAIYGERGGEREEDKMYLVKFVSVESEQWTSASNIDPESEALKNWRRAKAKARYRAKETSS